MPIADAFVTIRDIKIPVMSFAAVVVGSGAAGLAAALRLARGGIRPLALVTENRLAGTSRNTGSDKQTYYKLSLAGDALDSVGEMAATLFSGGCMDGDLARTEAALSAECFYGLCSLGVPFPRNRHGEAVGYKTDHDPKARATSAGPLTSRLMVEALEAELAGTDLVMLDHLQVIRILTDVGEPLQVQGLLCINRQAGGDAGLRYRILLSEKIVYAVGGPAMLYADSAYPASQMGGTGLAMEAGAVGKNLTEWQYGLASIAPRWNVSGSYQQVLPRYLSTDPQGGDPREFLDQWIPDEQKRLGAIFRKGYQWPFDVRKLDGSSQIDLLVYQETVLKGRRVFLDYRSNPGGGALDFARLDPEAADYLIRAGAVQQTPIERLKQLNQPAVDFYASHGIDLASDLLEIKLCAQHHNGGLAADNNWESHIRGFFPIGEVNGSHGIYRPGGSALNSGQVGALRAAESILAAQPKMMRESLTPSGLEQAARRVGWLEDHLAIRPTGEDLHDHLASRTPGEDPHDHMESRTPGEDPDDPDSVRANQVLSAVWLRAAQRMSKVGGPFRPIEELDEAVVAAMQDLVGLDACCQVHDAAGMAFLSRCRELLVTQRIYLSAMCDYASAGGCSRGSAVYLDAAGQLPAPGLPSFFRYRASDSAWTDRIQETWLEDGIIRSEWRPVRPLPHPDDNFETVWREYRQTNDLRIWHNVRRKKHCTGG